MSALDIVSRYRSRGLSGAELRAAVERHARLLTPLDGEDALALLNTPRHPKLLKRQLRLQAARR